MFTGIIEAIGSIRAMTPKGGDVRVYVATGKLDLGDVKLGDSIAVNGICLTAVELPGDGFWADVSRETLARTAFVDLKPGSAVNLEKVVRSTRLGEDINSPTEMEATVLDMAKQIKVVSQQDNLFEITATASKGSLSDSENAQLAQAIAQKLIDIFRDGQKRYGERANSDDIIRRLEEATGLSTGSCTTALRFLTGEGLLVADAEGMSVLTAWAAGKFDAERIAKAVKESGAAGKINHQSVIIPGHTAVLMGELEEELPGWTIKVGPREAVDLPAFLKLN